MLPLNGYLSFDGTTMDYIRFGRGKKALIILPGLGDGLQTVRGTAIPMSLAYRIFSKDYTVYGFSRKNALPEGYTTRDMADDLAKAMELLNIPEADLLGVSMGGMIAQHFAVRYPEKLGKLILAVTAPEPNPTITASIDEWVESAKRGEHTALMDSNVRKIYSDAYYRKNKWMIPVMGKLTKPKSYDRFFIQAEACAKHDCSDNLPQITAPTLVIGGGQDQIIGTGVAEAIAARIPGAVLKIYQQWGHGLYEEAEDFNSNVLAFLKGE